MKYLTGEKILAWLRRHFHDFKLRKNGQEVVMANPWGDSGKHFNISLTKRSIHNRSDFWVHDWRPGHQEHDGSFIKFVMSYKNISYVEALREVCGGHVDVRDYLRRSGSTKAKEDPKEELEDIVVELPASAKKLFESNDSLAYNMAINYLLNRSISEDLMKKYYMHYDATSIIFPYIEYGMLVYWQSRSLVGKMFEFPPESIGVTKSDFLYGFDHVEPHGDIIICEAIIDAISVGDDTVSFGGSHLSSKQVRKIGMLMPSRIVLAGDNDQPDKHGNRAGLQSIYKNYNLLKPYYNNIYYAIPPDPYKDWNDMLVQDINPRQYIDKHAKLIDLRTIISLRRR